MMRSTLKERLHKQKTFFERKEPGDLLVYINHWNRGLPRLNDYFYNLLANVEINELCRNAIVEEITLNYVTHLRESLFSFYLLDDDMLPAKTEVYFNIGPITGAMTGKKVKHAKQMSWCEPNMDWEEIEKLKFNPENPWILFSLGVNQALWKFWDED